MRQNQITIFLVEPFSSVKVTSMSFPLVRVNTTSVTFGGCGVLKVRSTVTGATAPGIEETPVVENISVEFVVGGKPEIVTPTTDGEVSNMASAQATDIIDDDIISTFEMSTVLII